MVRSARAGGSGADPVGPAAGGGVNGFLGRLDGEAVQHGGEGAALVDGPVPQHGSYTAAPAYSRVRGAAPL